MALFVDILDVVTTTGDPVVAAVALVLLPSVSFALVTAFVVLIPFLVASLVIAGLMALFVVIIAVGLVVIAAVDFVLTVPVFEALVLPSLVVARGSVVVLAVRLVGCCTVDFVVAATDWVVISSDFVVAPTVATLVAARLVVPPLTVAAAVVTVSCV